MGKGSGGSSPGSQLWDRIKAIEEKSGTFQTQLKEVQALLGINSGGVMAELEARAKEFDKIKEKVQGHLDGMNEVIQRNAEKARENADKLVEKVSGRVDKALADAREATKYLESERAQMKKAVDTFAGLDDHVTTCCDDLFQEGGQEGRVVKGRTTGCRSGLRQCAQSTGNFEGTGCPFAKGAARKGCYVEAQLEGQGHRAVR